MLSLPPSVRIFAAAGPTDLRKSFDGLCALVKDVLRQDPFSGHLFVFVNRRRDRVKVLYWDRSGFCLLYKRLEEGTFRDPGSGEIDIGALMMLLEGLEERGWRHRRWYQHQNAVEIPGEIC